MRSAMTPSRDVVCGIARRRRRGSVENSRRCGKALQVHGQRRRDGESTGFAHPLFSLLTQRFPVRPMRLMLRCPVSSNVADRDIERWENAAGPQRSPALHRNLQSRRNTMAEPKSLSTYSFRALHRCRTHLASGEPLLATALVQERRSTAPQASPAGCIINGGPPAPYLRIVSAQSVLARHRSRLELGLVRPDSCRFYGEGSIFFPVVPPHPTNQNQR